MGWNRIGMVEIAAYRGETRNAGRHRQLQALATEPTRPDTVIFDLYPTVIR
jgi:hypothetical protein